MSASRDPEQNKNYEFLQWAIERNYPECVKSILTEVKRIDINATNDSGCTPFL